MSKITITIKDKSKEAVFLNFLAQIPFVEIESKKMETVKKSADFKKLFGIWKNRKISLSDIRKKAWQR